MDRLEAVDQTTVFLAVSSMAPNPGTTADWKRELWEEIMKDVKDQMSELTVCGVSCPSIRKFAATTRKVFLGWSTERKAPTRLHPTLGFQWDAQGQPIYNHCGVAGHISRHCAPRHG